VSFFLLIIISLIIISKLNEFQFNILSSVSFIGQESAQRIREAISISIPQLLIDHYGLTLPILFLIGAYLFLKYKKQI
jgi:hypothetical protein